MKWIVALAFRSDSDWDWFQPTSRPRRTDVHAPGSSHLDIL